MGRLIGFIAVIFVLLTFIVLNIENVSAVSFGFHTFEKVPVFITAFGGFFLGMLCSLPFLVPLRRKKDAKKESKKDARSADKTADSSPANTNEQTGPYGID